MNPLRYIKKSLSLKVLIICALLLFFTLSVAFYFLKSRQESLLMEQVQSQAKILFKQIVLTRRWVADHGGIFVEKLPWVKKNIYLKDSEIMDVSGKRYIKENPAYVTRQLSEYSKQEGLYWFHITSLKLVNPANAPDEFERKALRMFERGEADELSKIEYVDGARYYRYIAPLYVESACISCHPGYGLGSVRGGISVTLPVEHLYKKMARLNREMIVAGLIISFLLLAILFFSIRAMAISPIVKLKKQISRYPESRLDERSLMAEDEIGELYRAFQKMAEEIQQYHSSLKDKIKEATQELQRTNQKLLEANRLYRQLSQRKSDFISNISHELRTPLTSIKGAVDYLHTRLSTQSPPQRLKDEEMRNFVEIIRSNTQRLIKMVECSLDLEKIESGRLDMEFSDLDLAGTIDDTINSFRPLFNERSISVETEIERPILVHADEDRIRQVLNNLLGNILEHCPACSRVKVEGYCSGDWAVVKISDNGPGIPSSLKERIFDKFVKGPRGGTGLGLSICKSIIEAHNGEIGLLNQKEGSTFYFKIPRIKKEK
ncbi:MAG: DUF3365 domain-containing protein [Nitrospirae bacterium]|nr:MAG: DUF3365 domain-containing protein [Nitrospirota bacterium]